RPLLARNLLPAGPVAGEATRRRVVLGSSGFFYLRVKGSGASPHLLIETTQTIVSAERSPYETATSDFALGIAANRRCGSGSFRRQPIVSKRSAAGDPRAKGCAVQQRGGIFRARRDHRRGCEHGAAVQDESDQRYLEVVDA